jgi:hypothetical protein
VDKEKILEKWLSYGHHQKNEDKTNASRNALIYKKMERVLMFFTGQNG